jgi:hypothetical protein
MHTYRLSNNDLIEIAKFAGITIYPAKLSIYLKHGGNAKNSLTDESILLIMGILGINIKTVVNSVSLTKENIESFFNEFFPEHAFPKYKRVPDRLITYYRSRGVMV